MRMCYPSMLPERSQTTQETTSWAICRRALQCWVTAPWGRERSPSAP